MSQKEFDEMFEVGQDKNTYGVDIEASCIWTEDNPPVVLLRLTGISEVYDQLSVQEQESLDENHKLRVKLAEAEANARELGIQKQELELKLEDSRKYHDMANDNTAYANKRADKFEQDLKVAQSRILLLEENERKMAEDLQQQREILSAYPAEEILKAARELVEFLHEEYKVLELGRDTYQVFEAQAIVDATSPLEQALPPESQPGG